MYDLGEMKEKKGRKRGKTALFFLFLKRSEPLTLAIVDPLPRVGRTPRGSRPCRLVSDDILKTLNPLKILRLSVFILYYSDNVNYRQSRVTLELPFSLGFGSVVSLSYASVRLIFSI